MKEHPWAIGIDIGGTKIEIARVDRSGALLNRSQFPTPVSEGFEKITTEIIETVKELQKQAASPPVAIGVGMAGQIDSATGIVKFAPNLKWTDAPLKERLQKALQLPVVVINDVRAGTWGELQHGAGKGAQELVCLFIGTGVGGGLVSQGRLIEGATNAAGELGHITVDLNGPWCVCGNRGCVEAFASGWALAKRAEDLLLAEPEQGKRIVALAQGATLTARHVLQAAKEGDPAALQLVETAINALTASCITYVNAFNPERLILGGGLGLALPQLVEKVTIGVKEHALSAATQNLQILPAALTTDAGVIGAASYALILETSAKF